MRKNQNTISFLVGAIIACFLISNIYLWRQKKILEARLKGSGFSGDYASTGTFFGDDSGAGNAGDPRTLEQMRLDYEKKLQELEEKNIACVEKLKVLAPWSEDILAPPAYASDIPRVLKTNYMGEIKVSWIPVKGVKRTKIVITDAEGKIVKTHYSPRTTLYLKNLPLPDKKTKAVYFVHLESINANDQSGPEGERREINVYPYSRIMAPGIEKISIED